MTCAAYGMLLRISAELDRAERRHAARVRGGESSRVEPSFDEPMEAPAQAPVVASAPSRKPSVNPVLAVTRGLRARIEPRFGAQR
jgi:cell division protein FtsW